MRLPLTASALTLSLAALGPLPNLAGDTPPPSSTALLSPTLANPTSLGEKWENLGRIYQSDTNPILQEFWLLGRYHGQYHWSEGSAGQSEGYETRRHRLGFQARLFEKLSLHAQMVSGSDFEPFYGGFTELWVQWAFSDEITLTLGQQKQRFTHDRNVSSRYINYLERSMMTNMFGADYTPAVAARKLLLRGRAGMARERGCEGVCQLHAHPVRHSKPVFLLQDGGATGEYILTTDPMLQCRKLPFANPYPAGHEKHARFQNRHQYLTHQTRTKSWQLLGYAMPADKADAKIEHRKLSDIEPLAKLFQPGECAKADELIVR